MYMFKCICFLVFLIGLCKIPSLLLCRILKILCILHERSVFLYTFSDYLCFIGHFYANLG